MEGEARSPSLGTGQGWTFRPGRRELAVFAALVVLGLLVWLASSPGMAARLFGVSLSPWVPADPLVFSFSTPVVCGALAFAAGFVLPNGFYLWGLALNLHGPFAEALTVYLMYQSDIELADGPEGIAGYVVLSAMLFVFTAFLYTALSAFGMGTRYLSRWMTGR